MNQLTILLRLGHGSVLPLTPIRCLPHTEIVLGLAMLTAERLELGTGTLKAGFPSVQVRDQVIDAGFPPLEPSHASSMKEDHKRNESLNDT